MPESSQVKILLLQNDTGFADHYSVVAGTTVEQLFRARVPDGVPASNYRITVNREVQEPTYVLKDGDRCVISPAKVAGAIAA